MAQVLFKYNLGVTMEADEERAKRAETAGNGRIINNIIEGEFEEVETPAEEVKQPIQNDSKDKENEMSELREKYQEKFGRKAPHTIKLETLREKVSNS